MPPVGPLCGPASAIISVGDLEGAARATGTRHATGTLGLSVYLGRIGALPAAAEGGSLPRWPAGACLADSKGAPGSPGSRAIQRTPLVSTNGSVSRSSQVSTSMATAKPSVVTLAVSTGGRPEASPGSLVPARVPRPGRAPRRPGRWRRVEVEKVDVQAVLGGIVRRMIEIDRGARKREPSLTPLADPLTASCLGLVRAHGRLPLNSSQDARYRPKNSQIRCQPSLAASGR